MAWILVPADGPTETPGEPTETAKPPIIAATRQRPVTSESVPRVETPRPMAAFTEHVDAAPAPPPPAAPAGDPDVWREVRSRLENGVALVDPERPLASRRWLTDALGSTALAPDEARAVREALSQLSERLVFGPEIVEGDPFCFEHVVASGDSLSKIVNKTYRLAVNWRLIQRINRLPTANSLRSGQTLKLVTGPFHVQVSKPDYRMDLYLGSGSQRVYVRSFDVGLGAEDGTPPGLFRVRKGSKLVNPTWTNPRTNEVFAADDPMNPLGEHWIGIEGIDKDTQRLGGYGIHGTIEPETIGTQASMGCVRMHADDVALIYEVLVEETSLVEITP
ncbi:MAG: L,D-transpeptidase family protein [Planctomycetota bacterium]